jgi:hypothetical protein
MFDETSRGSQGFSNRFLRVAISAASLSKAPNAEGQAAPRSTSLCTQLHAASGLVL